MHHIIAIVGPTAVGKSSLALSLAQALSAEIVNADSRQVYRHMDIGTAKPTLADRALVPHHMIDVADPRDSFSLALFQELARSAIRRIQDRGKQVLLVGGSGLYVWSLVEGWQVPHVPPDVEFRQQMEARANSQGADAFYQELKAVDPEAASRIHPRNVRRVVRALEVFQATGIPYSQLQSREPPPFDTLVLGLTTDRTDLYARIDARVDRMMEAGLVEEVRGLLRMGCGLHLPAMSSVGYTQIGRYLGGDLDLPTAVQQIKYETHRLARHQYAWFRRSDPRIHWLDAGEGLIERTIQITGRRPPQ